MPDLIYHSTPKVTFASNTFINVPTILQFDDTPLISIVKEQTLGYTTEIPIYHSDGTYLAKIRGNRVYSTSSGQTAGVRIIQHSSWWECSIDGRIAFEIRQQPGNAFRLSAELYTPDGYFVKVDDQAQPSVFNASGVALQIGGVTISNNLFQNLRIGVLISRDGKLAIGVG